MSNYDDVFIDDDDLSPEIKKDFQISKNQLYVREEEDTAIVDNNAPLTDKEKLFIMYYAESLNKTQAYKRAFPEDKVKFPAVKANALLEKPMIKKQVNELIQKTVDLEVSKSPALLLKMIERFLEIDPASYYHDDGSVIPLSELTVEQRLMINNVDKQISAKTGGVVLAYNLPNKQKTLDRLESLVTLVTKVRAVSGETTDTSGDAAKKRDEIFNSVLDGEEIAEVTEKIKKKKGRPRTNFKLNDLPEDIRKVVEERVRAEVLDDEPEDE
jgi:hypothetical protein